eukprot:11351249-Alexandrium_andersonii.AAC.1
MHRHTHADALVDVEYLEAYGITQSPRQLAMGNSTATNQAHNDRQQGQHNSNKACLKTRSTTLGN